MLILTSREKTMQTTRLSLPSLNPVRLLIIASICVLLFFSSVFPAAAIGMDKTKGVQGEDQLKGIEQKSEKVLESGPRSLEETKSKANQGINAVQGGADVNKMKEPGDSQKTKSVEDQIKEAVHDVMN